MYKVIFYHNKNGESELFDFFQSLNSKSATNKDARIMLKQFTLYINILSKTGTFAGAPFVKHLQGSIWELRPGRNRILFFTWHNSQIILLHHFLKTTQKTPKSEIYKANRELSDWIERNDNHGKSTI